MEQNIDSFWWLRGNVSFLVASLQNKHIVHWFYPGYFTLTINGDSDGKCLPIGNIQAIISDVTDIAESLGIQCTLLRVEYSVLEFLVPCDHNGVVILVMMLSNYACSLNEAVVEFTESKLLKLFPPQPLQPPKV